MKQVAGRIILLHGASSAGKSTLSEAVQRALEEPFLCFSSDILAVGRARSRSVLFLETSQ